ncbi:substrate-binding domain-containing protein [Gordonia sp. PKS22-38]|uniref:Substrate-binding domain-containing protein n=1 Tax=Gordonia prachuapensis TaxID=3115651 RepID=A0ABU7MMW4_9ACTN|nr:substrate-binding domain-containing protein [Gordonia sp. PKS22-38]
MLSSTASPARPRRRMVTFSAVLSSVILVVAGCVGTDDAPDSDGGTGAAGTPELTVAMITHEVPGDTFWEVVRRGADEAARKNGVDLQYSSDPEAPNQANLVQEAIDGDVDGIALTLAKPDAMAPVVQRALDAGVPVVAFNSGFDNWQDIGVAQYFGQDEMLAGRAAGERLIRDGRTNVLCVIHEQRQVALESRCAGVREGFTRGGFETLDVNSKDMASVVATLTAKLRQDQSVDSVVTLGAPIAQAAVESRDAAGSTAEIVTFDTNAALIDLIRGGDVRWAVDQQPYVQGHEAVDALWLTLTNASTVGGGQAVLTGPAWVDRSNVDEVAEYVRDGTR